MLSKLSFSRRSRKSTSDTASPAVSMSAAQVAIAYRSREELESSATEIACHLGVNTSCIVCSIERMEKGGERTKDRCPHFSPHLNLL